MVLGPGSPGLGSRAQRAPPPVQLMEEDGTQGWGGAEPTPAEGTRSGTRSDYSRVGALTWLRAGDIVLGEGRQVGKEVPKKLNPG